ncbi:MAG: hypothetical protein ACI9KS_000030 [Sulfitobacter sp.]|jgi:uncharacterized protein YjiS (DUF1127 family)
MAAFDTTPIQRTGLLAQVFSFISRVNLARLENAAYENTVRELNQLSDRELSDIGLGRGDIRDVARATALNA